MPNAKAPDLDPGSIAADARLEHASAVIELLAVPGIARRRLVYSRRQSAFLSLLLTGFVAACANSTTLPTPSGTPSPQRTSTPGSTAIPARPPLSYPPLTDTGSRATVIVDRLQVLDRLALVEFPANPQTLAGLGRGTEVLLTDGPLPNAHLDWYQVYFSWLPEDPPSFADVTFGWVAAGPTGQPQTSLSIEPPRCLDAVTANALGGMSILARLQCLGTGPYQVTGVIHGCTDYYVSGVPVWLFTECLNLVNPDGTPSGLFLFFPPQLDSARYHEGDVVRVVGHFDDPAALECRPTNAYPEIRPFEQESLVRQCRSAFVVSEIEVTDHLQLPQ